jgi:ATP-dependent DNA ligase
LRWNKGD